MAFRSDRSEFFAGADKVGTFLFSNFIWVVLSLTLVGIPLATLGLFAIMNNWVQGYQPEFFKVFGSSIRQHWRKAIIIGFIDLAVGGIIVINLSIFQFMALDNILALLSRTMTLCVAVILISINIYLWAQVSLLNLSIKNHLKLSLILVLTYPIRTLAITIVFVAPIVVSLFVPPLFFLFVTFSTCAYIGARATRWILHHHFSQEDLQALRYKD